MKKLNKRGFSLIDGLVAVFVLVLVVGLGFYAKNRIENRSGKAESGSERYSWTQIWNNKHGTTLYACKYRSAGYKIRVSGVKYTSQKRKVNVWQVRGGDKVLVYDRWLTHVTNGHWGQAQTGEVKFYLEDFGTERTIRFSSLNNC